MTQFDKWALEVVFCAVQHICKFREEAPQSQEIPMLVFLLATAALVVANVFTDYEAQREGLNEMKAGYQFGS